MHQVGLFVKISEYNWTLARDFETFISRNAKQECCPFDLIVQWNDVITDCRGTWFRLWGEMSRYDEWIDKQLHRQWVLYFRQDPWFLGALTKLRKATISFVLCLSVCPLVRPSVCLPSRPSVCPPAHAPFYLTVRPHTTTWLPLNGFSWNLEFEYFSKICRENSCFISIWQE